MSWWIAAFLYIIGAVEIYMVRRDERESFLTWVLAVAFWPIIVPIALLWK